MDLWTLTAAGVTYNLVATSVTAVLEGPNSLYIAGTGYADITGDAQTPASWSLTDTETGNSDITFSAANAVSPVPDAGTTAGMLGMAVGSCGLFVRKLKQRA